MAKLLRAENVTVSVNGRKILENVSCSIHRGEIVLIAGPNGSGKSTLLKTFMGLVDHEGRVILDGREITGTEPPERFRLGITLAPEKLRVAKNLTVGENIKIAGDPEHAFSLFPELKPLEDKKTGNLSGGERQMVVLARAFVSRPRYLLLDEPFQGLHKDVRERVIEYIEEYSKSTGIAVVTHDEIEEIFPMSEKICILTGGKVLYSGESRNAEKIVSEMFI
ncbi:ATP-binding cassette domain-containing protein [Geoglobus acetivorans]|uniref:ATP-binding cassette domain-containing protein n=1 Tax=Geoglobus acetivorans TaxID=565033 RepID=A0ABZ3H145_GEOAI|nr:ATP-binding cassette domain-containing protein [Geoglobus acetivorans]